MTKQIVKKKQYSVYEVAEQLGITPQAIYNYIARFFDDFIQAGCLEVKKKGLQRRHKITDLECFLKVLHKKGAEFETK